MNMDFETVNKEDSYQQKIFPLKKSIVWSMLMSLSPVLFVFLFYAEKVNFALLALLFSILVLFTSFISFISLYSFFSPGKRRWIWISLIALVMLVNFAITWWMSLVSEAEARGSGASALGGFLVLLLLFVILVPIVLYGAIAGYAVRRIVRVQRIQIASLIIAVFVASLPFLAWYFLPPFLEFLGDGLMYLSDFV